MTSALATLCLLVALFGAGVAVTSMAVASLWPWLGRRTAAAAPAHRERVAWLAAASPLVLPAAGVLLCLLPGLLALAGVGTDHCTRHADHPHLCLVHATLAFTPSLGLAAAFVLGAVALGTTWRARALARAARRVASLRRAPGADLGAGRVGIASPRPFAVTAGAWRPRILVSTRLLDALSPLHVEVVLAHERAHVRRRDPLRHALAALLSFPLPPSVRRDVLVTLELAAERACDESAARDLGDRLLVAEALLAVERLAGSASTGAPDAAVGFAGSTVDARVRGLLGPAPAATEGLAGRVALASLVLAIVAADPMHHAVEHLLQALLRMS
jgi:hypothetical protein